MTTTTTAKTNCPCGLDAPLEACCGRYLDGREHAPTAEALMRSRYSAYVVGNIDYILATHDPTSGGDVDRESTEAWSRQSKWLGLQIMATEKGRAQDDEGMVEFKASYSAGDKTATHHERSRFRKIDGRWAFVDGEMVKPKPVVKTEPDVGRNDPCPCGSNKKYKKCHGA